MTTADGNAGGGEKVSYTTKELVARIDSRLEEIVKEIHNKADKQTVELLAVKIDAVEDRVTAGMNLSFSSGPVADVLQQFRDMQKTVEDHTRTLSDEKRQRADRSTLRRWAAPVGLTVAGLTMQFAMYLHVIRTP